MRHCIHDLLRTNTRLGTKQNYEVVKFLALSFLICDPQLCLQIQVGLQASKREHEEMSTR